MEWAFTIDGVAEAIDHAAEPRARGTRHWLGAFKDDSRTGANGFDRVIGGKQCAIAAEAYDLTTSWACALHSCTGAERQRLNRARRFDQGTRQTGNTAFEATRIKRIDLFS